MNIRSYTYILGVALAAADRNRYLEAVILYSTAVAGSYRKNVMKHVPGLEVKGRELCVSL